MVVLQYILFGIIYVILDGMVLPRLCASMYGIEKTSQNKMAPQATAIHRQQEQKTLQSFGGTYIFTMLHHITTPHVNDRALTPKVFLFLLFYKVENALPKPRLRTGGILVQPDVFYVIFEGGRQPKSLPALPWFTA